MRFQVPQFIEVEDKIFGPLTLKQFIYLAGAGGALFILLKMFPLVIAIFVAIPVVALAVALAFYKINNRPFALVLESAFKYILSNRLYIWKSKDIKQIIAEKSKADGIINSKAKSEVNIPKLSSNKLKDIAWSLDIKESIYSDTSQQN
jgi:hypothetical protein